MTAGEFYEKILVICRKCNCSVISGYRTEKHNKAVGGVERSLHLVGYACDLEPDDDASLPDIEYWAKRMGLSVKLYASSAHVQIY